MKILKRILVGLLIIIALVFLAGLFMTRDFIVERSVVINKPVTEVFPYIRQIKNQDHYSYWNMKDPNMKKEYQGADGTVGFVYSWDSQDEHVGKGSQTIAAIDENKQMSMNLHFEKPFKDDNKAFMTTESVSPASTRVNWRFEGVMEYPKNLMIPMMKGMVGDQLQTGLNNLKKNLEG